MPNPDRFKNYPSPITLRMSNGERRLLETQAAERRFNTTSAYIRFLIKQDQVPAADFAARNRTHAS